MRLIWNATIVCTLLLSARALASDAADSLMKADRELASQSRQIGFVAAYSKAMATDARKLDGGVPAAVGRDSILALMSRYASDLTINWTPEEAVVAASGELGFTWGHFVSTSHDKQGRLITGYGKYLDVWRREKDGVWRWIADIDSGPDPAPGDKSANPGPP